MTTQYIKYPAGGSGSGVSAYTTAAAFPVAPDNGTLAIALDTHLLYEFNGTSWVVIAPVSIGTANGLSLSASLALSLQLATSSVPGALSAADWTTFNNKQSTSEKGAANGYAPLDASAKVPYANLPSALMTFKGAWDVVANSPTLADGTGTAGDTYRASTAGTRNLGSGNQTWAVGDFVIYNGAIWEHSPAADGVSSVNGMSGAVSLAQGNLTEATSSILTIAGGTSAVWGTGTTIQVAAASASQSGYLSSTDWSTFNGKQAAGTYLKADGTVGLSADWNAGAHTITATTFSGNLSGQVATQVGSTNTNYYPTFVGTGNVNANNTILTNTSIAFNPSTGTLTTTTFSGALSGNATTATTATSFSGSLAGDVTGTQGSTAISAATVTGKLITGFVSGAGTVAATDTVLQAINKLDGNAAGKIPASAFTAKGAILGGTGSATYAALALGTDGYALVADSTQATGLKWALNGGGAIGPTVSKCLGASGNTGGFPATSASGTYTTPAGVIFIRVRMVGGGGGGAGSGTAAGAAAGDGAASTFSTITANGGNHAVFSASSTATGGTATLGAGPIGLATSGASGTGNSVNVTSSATYLAGGSGGGTPFAGGGAGGSGGNAGAAALSNTGAGGGGGGSGSQVNNYSGGGGGAGGFVDAIIVAPGASYSYSVGAGGSAGGLGTNGSAGGAGGSGYIEVTEYYAPGTIGTATNVTGTVAVANGGTGATTAAGARANLLVAPTVQTFLQTSYYSFVTTTSTPTYAAGDTYTNNSSTFTVVYASTVSGASLMVAYRSSGTNAPSASGNLTRASGSGTSTIAYSSVAATGTYIPPTSPAPLWIKVEMVGGGGGGAAAGTSATNGSTANDTTFSSYLTARGGAGGGSDAQGGAGGMVAITPTTGVSILKQVAGGGGATGSGSVTYEMGGNGGSSALGGAGVGGTNQATNTGTAAAANSGSGGGGSAGGLAGQMGAGGGSGAFIEAYVSGAALTTSYTFMVGAKGAGGTGAYAGGPGGDGALMITEYYQ